MNLIPTASILYFLLLVPMNNGSAGKDPCTFTMATEDHKKVDFVITPLKKNSQTPINFVGLTSNDGVLTIPGDTLKKYEGFAFTLRITEPSPFSKIYNYSQDERIESKYPTIGRLCGNAVILKRRKIN